MAGRRKNALMMESLMGFKLRAADGVELFALQCSRLKETVNSALYAW